MADRVRKVSYCYLKTSNRAGQGAKVMSELADAGVNLLAFSGFPAKGGKSQLDFVTDDTATPRQVTRLETEQGEAGVLDPGTGPRRRRVRTSRETGPGGRKST